MSSLDGSCPDRLARQSSTTSRRPGRPPQQSSSTSQSSQSYQCPECHRSVRTEQGLKSHITRKHPSVASQDLPDPTPTGVSGPEVDGPPTTVDRLGVTLGRLRSSIRVLRRIPKGARTAAANALADSIEDCVSNNTPEKWCRLLSFAAICLRLPSVTQDGQTNLTTMIKKNIQAYSSGCSVPLPSDRLSSRSKPAEPSFNAKVVQSKLSEGDVRGAVRCLGSADSIAPFNPQTLDILKNLHPEPVPGKNHNPETEVPPSTPLRVTESAVAGVLASFPAGSAGGLDFLRPQHLKDLTSHSAGASGVRLLSSLTKLCNIMLEGGVPDTICPLLYGAALCAFTKPSGGIRPNCNRYNLPPPGS